MISDQNLMYDINNNSICAKSFSGYRDNIHLAYETENSTDKYAQKSLNMTNCFQGYTFYLIFVN